jgi:hypothetical protein
MGAQKCVTAEPHVSKIYIRQSLSKDWKLSGLASAIGQVAFLPFTSNIKYFVSLLQLEGASSSWQTRQKSRVYRLILQAQRVTT